MGPLRGLLFDLNVKLLSLEMNTSLAINITIFELFHDQGCRALAA